MKVVRLWPHQEDAVQAACGSLAGGGRAQVVMAMGTGKTLVGQAAAARLLPAGGTVAVLVPSLALVYQTLRAWRATSNVTDVLAVCSADDPGEAGGHALDADGDDLSALVAGESAPWAEATTEPDRIAQWLAAAGPDDQRQGLRLLLATYHSVPRIADAYAADPGLARLGLVIFDEAHRAAADPEALFATALHDDRVPADRRLFLTATPRLQVADPDDPRAAEVFEGMSSQSWFGPRVYEIGVAEAITRRLLSDYRVVVIGVTDAQVHKLVLDNAPLLVGPAEADARTVAAQVALAQAARAYDLRRVLVFHNRVASSQRFAEVLPHVLDALPRGLRPAGALACHHVDATSSATAREVALAHLGAPEQDGWSVVSNVRVLSEGIDCPALDAIVFAEPREGQTSTVQAIGRALRLHPERDQPAVILIPVFLVPGENGELAADDSDFSAVWQILRALRDRDGRVGAQLVGASRDLAARGDGDPPPVLPDWLDLHLPAEVDDGFLTAFSTRLLDGTVHLHEHGMGRLTAYVTRFGHAAPPDLYTDDTGFRLGRWVTERRRDRLRGILDPGLAAELEALPGWRWSLPRSRFDQAPAAMADYAAAHGHTRIPSGYKTPDGLALGSWVSRQRRWYQAGELAPELIAALEAIPGWTWQPQSDQQWEHNVALLLAFSQEHGHAEVPRGYRSPDGTKLGSWVAARRVKRDQIPPERARQLEAIPGWSWTGQAHAARQNRMVAEVASYYAQHGPGPVPKGYCTPSGLKLGSWVQVQVGDYLAGRIDPDLAAALDQIPGFAWGAREAIFSDLLRRLAGYAAEHGTASPPSQYVSPDGYPLGRQAASLRAKHRAGQIAASRADALEKLPGWSWGPWAPRPKHGRSPQKRPQKQFTAAAADMRAYAEEHGTCSLPPMTKASDGYNLTSWAARQRRAYRNGTLDPEHRAVLESIPGWYWDHTQPAWDRGLAALRAYVAEHGTAVMPAHYRTADDYGLGDWVAERREDKRQGRLSAERIAILEAFPGWFWNLYDRFWDEGLRQLRAYVAEHGTAAVPRNYRTPDNHPLGPWVKERRRDQKEGRLAAERKAILESLPGWRW